MTEPSASSFVVGTAGHIDHGKSTLVKALTQIDPDRLEEEKRRGMTIDLCFAYLLLPTRRRVREEGAGLLRGTCLEGAPIVAVSGATGAGLDELRAALDAELAQTTPRPDAGRPRLPVDRSFAMAGFGTVVTGTLVGGALRQGDDLVVLPGERRGRGRGLPPPKRPAGEGRPGSRTPAHPLGGGPAPDGRGHRPGAP